MIHGRPGRRASHRWYRVELPAPRTLRLKDPVDGSTLCELRGTGAQTVAPPTRHPSGELLEWEAEGEPALARHADLERAVRALAAAAVLARAWPAQGGRHDAALALAGMLLRGGMAEAEAARFLGAVAAGALNGEAEDRVRAVATTAEALRRDDARVTGWPTALEVFGEKRLRRAAEWLELRSGHAFDGWTQQGTRGSPQGAARRRP